MFRLLSTKLLFHLETHPGKSGYSMLTLLDQQWFSINVAIVEA